MTALAGQGLFRELTLEMWVSGGWIEVCPRR